MNTEIEIPSEFGGSFETFFREWCREDVLGYSRAEISRGLTTLKRLCPEYHAEHLAHGSRGLWVPTLCIETGLLLSASESAKYFDGVLDRLRTGQRAAYSELVVGSALRQLGYDVQYESGEGQPDLLCDVGGTRVAFEVYAPDASYASQEQRRLADALQHAVTETIGDSQVEIAILKEFDKTGIAAAVQAVREAPASQWTPVGSWAQVRRIDLGHTLAPTFDGAGAQVHFGSDVDVKGFGKSVILRWDAVDTRAGRALESKRRQVKETFANVVVMDACAVGGIAEWPEMIAGLAGLEFNKIGAVVFFQQGCLGPPERVRRRWRSVDNPHAVRSAPKSLLTGFESLDESTFYGLPAKPRLAMP